MFLRRSYGFRSVGVLRLLLVWNKVEKLEWLSSIFLLHQSLLKRMLLTALTLCTRDKMVELLSVCEVAFQVVFEADDSGRGSFMSLTLLCVFWTCHSRCITLLFLCKIKGSLDHFQNVLLWLCVTRNNLKGLFVLLDFLSKPLSCRRLVCLIFCWAALKYLAVQVDWQTVGLFVKILIHTCVKIISLRWLSYHFYSKFDLTVTQYMHDPLDLKVQCFQSDCCCCWHCSNWQL